jgi:hypothetical protein
VVTAATGTLTLSGVATEQVAVVTAAVGALSLTGLAPVTVAALVVGTGTLTLTGVETEQVTVITGAVGGLNLTGLATPTVAISLPVGGTVTLTGLAGFITGAAVLAAGTLTLTGVATEQVTVVTAAVGGLSVTGLVTVAGRVVTDGTGSIALTGLATPAATGVFAAVGPLVVSGVAGFVTAMSWAGVGGIAVTGLGYPTVTGTHITTGRLILDGNATTGASTALIVDPIGPLLVTGIAGTVVTGVALVGGTLAVTGTDRGFASYIYNLAGGRLAVTDTLVPFISFALTASGGLVAAGSAATRTGALIVPQGRLTATGSVPATLYFRYLGTAGGNLVPDGCRQVVGHGHFCRLQGVRFLGRDGVNKPQSQYTFDIASGRLFHSIEGVADVLESCPPLNLGQTQDQLCDSVGKDSFFRLLSPNQSIQQVLVALGPARWELVCFDRDRREGTVLLDGTRLVVIQVPSRDGFTNTADARPPLPTQLVNRTGVGAPFRVPTGTCSTITNDELYNLLGADQGIKQALARLGPDRWIAICFDRAKLEATILIDATRMIVVHVPPPSRSSGPAETPALPTILTNRTGQGVTGTKTPVRPASITQDGILALMNGRGISPMLGRLDRSQWAVRAFDRTRRKADLLIQNRLVTVDV